MENMDELRTGWEDKFFRTPNEIFDNGLNTQEIVIYTYLCRLAHNNSKKMAFPGFGTISKKCQILNGKDNTCRVTTQRIVDKMVKKGYITKVNRGKKNNGENQSNLYTLIHPNNWVVTPSKSKKTVENKWVENKTKDKVVTPVTSDLNKVDETPTKPIDREVVTRVTSKKNVGDIGVEENEKSESVTYKDLLKRNTTKQTKKVLKEVVVISENLSNAITKTKRNIFVSKSWNKRVDNKIIKIVEESGEEYAIKILNNLYENLKSDIKKSLVQYIKGIIKNIETEETKIEFVIDKEEINNVKPIEEIKEAEKINDEPKETLSELERKKNLVIKKLMNSNNTKGISKLAVINDLDKLNNFIEKNSIEL